MATRRKDSSRDLSALLPWYFEHRRDLPWRRTRDPYAILVSETMLQQTRVDTVLPYYERFMAELPTVRALAEAPEERVLSLWSGLGYYRRARMLRAAAQRVVEQHAAAIPGEVEQLRGLEGVGAYTAGAVASIAFGRRAALVDGNVARVLARVFAVEDDVKTAAGHARVWRLAEDLVGRTRGEPGDWNQALMELGATTCTPRAPACPTCPLAARCDARRRGIQSELPRVKAPREASVVRRVAIVLASKTAVVLARRRADGLFGGMWEPPGAEGDIEALGELARRLGIPRASLLPSGEIVHVLSHRRFLVKVFRAPWASSRLRRRWHVPGADYDAIDAVALADLAARPQATFARKILAAARVAKLPGRGLRWAK